MLDLAEWVAIGLGLLAVGIAVWDDIRDRYYWNRARGAVDVRLEVFDIPQRNVLLQTIGPPGATRAVRGTLVRLEWSIWNHVSWPVYVSFSFRHTLGPTAFLWEAVMDELLEEKGGPSMYVPPRQPFHRTVWLTIAEGAEGEITPQVYVLSKVGRTAKPQTKRLRWSEGLPALE